MDIKIFRRNPYRGILTEIAKQEGITRQAIHQAIFVCENPRIITIATEKMNQRKKISDKARREFKKAGATLN